MRSVLLAFQNPEACETIRKVVVGGGYSVEAECQSGADVIRTLSRINDVIVICSYKLGDMTAAQLGETLGDSVAAVVLLSQQQQQMQMDIPENMLTLRMPLSKRALIDTLDNILRLKHAAKSNGDERPPRTEDEKKMIEAAKGVLMERHNMSENQAHRYIQKQSMNSGRKMIDTAMIILAEGL
ncbi:MAG: ANTAR domain-containing protein [Clostridia bacterium]|nr:ANTAR domain-containing protein [Clostridia bacterium]